MRASKCKLVAAFLLLSSLAACSGEAASTRGARRSIVDSSGGTVALGIGGKRSYRPAAVLPTGSISGTISIQGDTTDSVVAVGKDAKVCGDSASVKHAGAAGEPKRALVWIDGITTGKPLPMVRRETLTIEKCRFEPRLMAVVTTSTINVFSRDRIAHGPHFYREGVGDAVEEIQTVDAGQVVPSEKIASAPGIIEVRCAEHPFARGFIAVFEHPYFAVTDEQGAFTIDGVAPGTYTVKVWREGLPKPVDHRVVVAGNGAARLDVPLQ